MFLFLYLYFSTTHVHSLSLCSLCSPSILILSSPTPNTHVSQIAAAFTRSEVSLPIFFYTGSYVHAGDSQTTAAEISQALASSESRGDMTYSVYVCSRNMEQVCVCVCVCVMMMMMIRN